MYAKCGSIEDAWRMFNKMPFGDVVMVFRHVKCRKGQKMLELFRQTGNCAAKPINFVGVLNA
jgi:pentatricopeptide repeat protein